MNTALLTIDDFSSKNTPAIVDYLKEKGIKIIFFAEGRKVEQFYEEAKYALKNGMIVGNHSYSHPAFSSISVEEGIAEIEKCEKVLDKLYADCGVERIYRPFRFPYGDKGGANKEAYQKYYESMDPATAEVLYKQVVSQIEENAEIEAYAQAYSEMKPKQAAGIFEEMTDNLELAARILGEMEADERGAILGVMDPAVAAKLTKIMEPDS